MPKDLDLSLFTNVNDDYEKRKYQVLGSLRSVKDEFNQNRIYPWLGKLIELQRNLSMLLQGFDAVRKSGPRRIKRVDMINQKIEFESVLPENLDLHAVEELVRWAVPLIREAIEEGITIYEFVDENLNMEKVGIQPGYQSEGYTFVPDPMKGKLLLFRYEVSIFIGPDEKYRAIKTTLVKTLDQQSLTSDPGTLKMELIKEFRELPNPATYSFYTGLDFPFDPTIFPVAKRKLLQTITAGD